MQPAVEYFQAGGWKRGTTVWGVVTGLNVGKSAAVLGQVEAGSREDCSGRRVRVGCRLGWRRYVVGWWVELGLGGCCCCCWYVRCGGCCAVLCCAGRNQLDAEGRASALSV